ncbi:MAG TPA: ComF family protein [Rhizorhapis sp.]|nr:ComF family protein [Rhizorhapis sp.]
MNILHALSRAIVDFALPPRCPACGIITTGAQSFCPLCWQKMEWLGSPCCESCALPFAYEQPEGSRCGACLANPPAYDRARSVIAYGEVARHVALKLKYGRKIGLARLIAGLMERHVPGEYRENLVLVPVPLHRWRLWSRGFNQSALIAQALGRSLGLATELEVLKRVKATPPLRGFNPRERAKAVAGAFAVDKADRPLLSGKTVVLIDDVYTSGATANGCARILKRAGAASVHLLCWARVIADEEEPQLTMAEPMPIS